MEFEEMQKIWNEQKGETMYAINETAMHNSVTRKKNAASRRINKVEIALMIINSICTIMLLMKSLNDTHYWNLITSMMMLGTVIYIGYKRYQRKHSENTFDRSLLGELDHAIANTNSIIHISRMMIFGYLIPFSVFFLIKLISQGATLERWLIIAGMYLLAFVLIQWERKKMHIPRKDSLVALRNKLAEE